MTTRTRFLPEIIAALLFVSVVVSSLTGSEDTGTIGPVDSVVLAGEHGDITIKNAENRISWGEEKTSRAWSIGFMEIGKALAQLLQADHFNEAREELNEELTDQIEEVRAALDSIMEEGKQVDPDDPEAPAIRARWEQVYGEFQRMQQLGVEARSALLAEQMETAYNEIVEAVNVVAERMNIDMVLRFIPPDREFQVGNPDATIMQIRLRTALRYPESIDITDDVLSELGLDVQ